MGVGGGVGVLNPLRTMPLIRLGKSGRDWAHLVTQPTAVLLDAIRSLLFLISMQKGLDTDCFFPGILVIKESCNLIGQETILVNHLKV